LSRTKAKAEVTRQMFPLNETPAGGVFFMKEIQFKPLLHLLMCTNQREGSSCSPGVTDEDVRTMKLWIRQQGWTGQVICTKTKCLGFCHPTQSVAALYPEGKFFYYEQLSELQELLTSAVNNVIQN
jgi:(2Fe-2S) ferredoxin